MEDNSYICHYCEELVTRPTRDHIIPVSKVKKLIEKGKPLPEGHNDKVWACFPCNFNKGTKDYQSFKALGVKQIRHLKKLFEMNQIKNKKKGERKNRY